MMGLDNNTKMIWFSFQITALCVIPMTWQHWVMVVGLIVGGSSIFNIFSFFGHRMLRQVSISLNIWRTAFMHADPKQKKDSQVKLLFALLVSVLVKAARKHIDEIDPRRKRGNGNWKRNELPRCKVVCTATTTQRRSPPNDDGGKMCRFCIV